MLCSELFLYYVGIFLSILAIYSMVLSGSAGQRQSTLLPVKHVIERVKKQSSGK